MPRIRIKYDRQDAAGQALANVTAAMRAVQQRPVSGYASARFAEWEQNAPEREALLQARLQKAQSDAELAGANFRYKVWQDEDIKNQMKAYWNGMPILQEQLKQAGIYPGDPRYRAEMGAFLSELPDAIHVPVIEEDLKRYSRVDETSGQIADKIKTFREGFEQAGERLRKTYLSKEGLISGEGVPQQDRTLAAYDLTPEQIKNPVYVSVGKLEPTETGGLKFTGDRSGDIVSIDVGKGDQMRRIPVQKYLEAGGKLSPEDMQAQIKAGRIQPQAATTPTPSPSATPEQITNQPEIKHLGRYNPETGEYE